MKRNDRQITDQDLILQILEENTICRLAFSDNENPYIVPVNYGYNNNRIYFHSANDGKKINIIRFNNKVFHHRRNTNGSKGKHNKYVPFLIGQ